MSYEMLKNHAHLQIGDIVYDYLEYDNGQSIFQTLNNNEVHISVTTDKNGKGQVVTIPIHAVRIIQENKSVNGSPAKVLANMILALLSEQSLTTQQWNYLENLHIHKNFRDTIKELRKKSHNY